MKTKKCCQCLTFDAWNILKLQLLTDFIKTCIYYISLLFIITIYILEKSWFIQYLNTISFILHNKGTYSEFHYMNKTFSGKKCEFIIVRNFFWHVLLESWRDLTFHSVFINKLHIPQEILLIPSERQVANVQPYKMINIPLKPSFE